MRGWIRHVWQTLMPWAVGAFLVLVALGEQVHDLGGLGKEAALLLAIVQGVGLWWRRERPVLAAAVVLVAALGFQLLIPAIVVPFGALFAVGSLAAACPPRVSLLGLAGYEVIAATNFFFDTTPEDSVFTMAIGVGAWALGEATRSRRVAIREESRRAMGEEKERIARELHDVIAHSVSVIVVQAAAADDVFDTRPDQARAALRSIEQSGRDALTELRRLLGGLGPEAADSTHPQPGLGRLEELAEPLRAGGLEVVVRSEGEAPELPAGVDLSAYRIVQEALTNTLRHARATRAEVVVRYGAEAVEVEVRDDGRGVPAGDANGAGRGLVGMRERAALLGGTLDAGALAGGGYRVHARLPLEAEP